MSSRDMTINEIKAADKEFGATHTIPVKGFKDGGKVTIADVLAEMRKGFTQINARIDKLELRIDNLENLVVTQFKKHGWVK